MGVQISIRCDICNVERLQTNHWYMISKQNAAKKLIIEPLSLLMIEEFNYDILCGEECVHKYIAQHLAELHKPTS